MQRIQPSTQLCRIRITRQSTANEERPFASTVPHSDLNLAETDIVLKL
jgi:hypothetical protein